MHIKTILLVVGIIVVLGITIYVALQTQDISKITGIIKSRAEGTNGIPNYGSDGRDELAYNSTTTTATPGLTESSDENDATKGGVPFTPTPTFGDTYTNLNLATSTPTAQPEETNLMEAGIADKLPIFLMGAASLIVLAFVF